MLKKLEILRVTLPHFPQLLLLDEPFSGLDVDNRRFLNDLIENKGQNSTIVICSHNFEGIIGLCDRILFLVNGRILKVLMPDQYDSFLERLSN